MTPTAELASWLQQRCLELISIPSVTGDERLITDHLEEWARELPHLGPSDVARLGNNLVVGHNDESRPLILLVGHTDTVPPTPDYAGPSVDGDRIVGLGSTDMKGSLAVMQALHHFLRLDHLPFNVALVFYDKEEGPYQDNGLQPLLDRYEWLKDADLAIAMEPTDNTLQLGCMGGLQARITFEGQAAHSGRPWQGKNAIHEAAPLLMELLTRPYPVRHVGGLAFREAVSVTLCQGGRARNVIPDRFELNINYRFAPEADAEAARLRAEQDLRRMARGAQVDIHDAAPAGPVAIDNLIVRHLRAVAELQVEPKQAWTDVARLAQNGIDAVNYGPGMGAQAHQAGEWISLADMVASFRVLESALGTPMSHRG